MTIYQVTLNFANDINNFFIDLIECQLVILYVLQTATNLVPTHLPFYNRNFLRNFE